MPGQQWLSWLFVVLCFSCSVVEVCGRDNSGTIEATKKTRTEVDKRWRILETTSTVIWSDCWVNARSRVRNRGHILEVAVQSKSDGKYRGTLRRGMKDYEDGNHRKFLPFQRELFVSWVKSDQMLWNWSQGDQLSFCIEPGGKL